jgi:predicted O-linked N-acetylglucosamine transferase (SPINDLY family)
MPELSIHQAFQLALAHHQANRLQQAEQVYRLILQRHPGDSAALGLLGIVCGQTGRQPQGIGLLQQAIAAVPKTPEFAGRLRRFYDYLGRFLAETGQLEAAINSFRAALTLNPQDVAALINLGRVLDAAGQLDEAIQCARQAIELEPTSPDSHYNLALALQKKPLPADSEAHYRRAIELRPDYADAHGNLGVLLQQQLRLEDAEACYRRAIELRPDHADAHNNLANLLKWQRRLSEGIDHQRRALAIRPDYVQAHSSLLVDMHYDASYDSPTIFAEHLRWAQQHATEAMKRITPHANSREASRRLRIGYLSPDFYHHSVAFFFEPILAGRDRSQFEVFCYSNVQRPDATTQRLRNMADGWRDILPHTDEQVAELVRSDGIDILIDLAGHTVGNRLLVLAQKPAPVQMTYLGYPDTTGLPTVDYRITDAVSDPPGTTEQYHTEQLLRLEGCFLCYRPHEDAPPVAELPAARSGQITFGCFNNLAKLTGPMLRLWARILHATAGSRLLLKDKSFASAQTRERLLAELASEGISPDRIGLLGYEPACQKHLDLYARVDVALDTYPYCGTATTCEALWMGVPVVSLAGRSHVSRVGHSLLNAAGLPELAAPDEPSYITVATDLAHDLPKLASLRLGLRERMKQSALMDAPAFMRRLESAYRRAWANWCGAPK